MVSSWKIFHSDNGDEFTSNSVREFLKRLKRDDIQGTPHHPQSQEQIERFNRTIKSCTRKFFGSDSIRYVDKLPEILYQYNTSSHKATKIYPFVLFFGQPLGFKLWRFKSSFRCSTITRPVLEICRKLSIRI
ncbi:Pro-Pol polyprotein [Cucumispora dikerogammari]|nr:Pro-Pol polyprotein [Cucumispora dikerogammari]